MVESSLQTGYVKHAPGFVENEGPKLITSRFKHTDSFTLDKYCLLYTSPSPRDYAASRMPSSA